jgi:hypothetical protein
MSCSLDSVQKSSSSLLAQDASLDRILLGYKNIEEDPLSHSFLKIGKRHPPLTGQKCISRTRNGKNWYPATVGNILKIRTT